MTKIKKQTLEILDDSHAVLHKKALPIETITPYIQNLAETMVEMVDDEWVAGLAAPQIGKSIRLIICKYFLNDDEYTIVEMINPEILKQSDTIQEYEEGCLSVPKVFEYIKRPSNITVKFTALDGEDYEIEAQGYNAQIIQHEIDHLEGILFTERM